MSLEITYRILTKSTRPEAIEILARGIASGDAETINQCCRVLAMRDCRRSHELLIASWPHHSDAIMAAIQGCESGFCETVTELLGNELAMDQQPTSDGELSAAGQQRLRTLTSITTVLSIRTAMPAMISAAWKHRSHVVRQCYVDAVVSLCQVWGKQARRHYAGVRPDSTTERLRGEVSSQLFETVKNFQTHRCEDLIDAFLFLSSWDDPALRSSFDDDHPCRTLMIRRLRSSHHHSVLELLAGYIRRRSIPSSVLALMMQRTDAMYCETLLHTISPEPTTATFGNLKEYGLPDCLRGGVALLQTIGSDRDAALAHAYANAMQHDPETIAVLLEILQRHSGETSADVQTRAAVAISLARCDIPDVNYWLLAFESQRIDEWLSDDTAITPSNSRSLEDRAAEVCMRLVQSVHSPDANIAKLSLRLLRELNINNTLTLFPELSSDQRLRIGRVLMQIDPETLDTVRDGLRHAVMRRRLEAIEFAQTLGLVDLMIEPFTVIVKNDHQSVRLAAAAAMGAAVSEASAELLRELSASPHGSLRETAIEALHRRGITV